MNLEKYGSTRDPFPYPRQQNDNDFKGRLKPTKRPWPATTEEPLCQNEQPWNRLYNNQTLSSKRHTHHYFDPQSPLDKLDFAIKTEYDQHHDAFHDSNEIVFQRETCCNDHGRILKNRKKEVPPAFDPMYPPLRTEVSKKKPHPHKNPGAIQGHHTTTTNGGYSRKHDGGFYVI